MFSQTTQCTYKSVGAECCNVLQCVAVCCSVLQRVVLDSQTLEYARLQVCLFSVLPIGSEFHCCYNQKGVKGYDLHISRQMYYVCIS